MASGRILLAEDDKPILRLVSDVLTRAGFEVEVVQDGREAITKLTSEDFDVVVLDLMMPELSGYDVLDWMKRERPGTSKASVVILTAVARSALDKVDEEQVFAIIRKPFEIDGLLAVLERCVEARKCRRSAL